MHSPQVSRRRRRRQLGNRYPPNPSTPDACAANPGCLFLEEPRQRGERRCHGQRVCQLAAVQISSRQSRAVCDSPRPRAESRPGHRKGSAAVGGGRMGEVVTRVGLAVFSPHPAPSNVSNSQRDCCTAACLRLASGLGCQHRDIAARPRWAAVTLSFRPGFGELSTSLPPAGYKDPVQR